MNSAFPCSICKEGGHKAAKCPELYHPEKASGGGGGGHDHDDEEEKVVPLMIASFVGTVATVKVPAV